MVGVNGTATRRVVGCSATAQSVRAAGTTWEQDNKANQMTDRAYTTQRRYRLNSVLVKIAALLLVSGMVVSTTMAWNGVRTTLQLIREQTSHTAAETNDLLAVSAAQGIQLRATGQLNVLFEPFFETDNRETVYAMAVDYNNAVLVEGGRSPELLEPLRTLSARALSEGVSVASADGMLVATPIVNVVSGKTAGAVATAWSAADAIATERRATLYNVLIAIGIVGIAMLWMMLAVDRWVAAPIARLSRTVDRLAGEEYDLEVPFATRGDELGDIGRAVSHLRDELVVGRERARENRFRGTAYEESSAAVMMVDADLKIISVNETLAAMLDTHADNFRVSTPEFDPSQVVGAHIDVFHSGAAKDRVRAVLLDPANLPYRAEIAAGDARFRLVISRVETEQATLDGFVVEWTDVTAQFMNEAILASIEANQIRAEFALDGTLLRGNALLSEAIGQDADALVGNASDQLFDFDRELAELNGPVFDQINNGNAVYGQFRLKRSDGDIAVVEGGFAPVRDSSGTLLRIVLIGKDVTEAQAKLKRSEAQREALQTAQAKVVDALRGALEKLADGDLTSRIDTVFAADYDRLRTDFNQAVGRLQTAMQGVIENAQLIQGEASEISNAADDLSSRTERQAATLEQTASALDQLTASVKSSADGAAHANALVDGARTDAEASGAVVREAVEAMGEIENSSQQISKITGVIDDIAFQTNLLALNAGVEAARAGEAGRGFAVVASEVRALAQRSSDAAREINALISASDGQVKRGVDLVDQAGKALAGIVDGVQKISQNMSEIAQSSQEQSSGLAEINTAMNQLDQVTQQNAAMFEQTTAASHALTREAETLTLTMARFQTDGAAQSDNVVTAGFTGTPHAPAVPMPTAAHLERVSGDQASGTTVTEDDGWDEF